MIRSRFFRSFVLALTVAATISCSDSATGPAQVGPLAPAQAQDGLLSGVVGTVTGLLGSVLKIIGFQSDPNGIPVNAVRWSGSHTNQTRSVSATIGYYGGTLAIPGSDFSITFPRGAVSSPTYISITSDNSGYVSYDMKPHGIKFATPVFVTQRLNNTAVYGTSKALNAFGAYFPQDPLDLSGILKALEIEATVIFSNSKGQAEVETWQINHFSRYMLASG
ncbi:MAG: hypothetical protein ACJ8AJ_06005 [Gemmatimonadaceae bacterium]|jgi:hypothetical protein